MDKTVGFLMSRLAIGMSDNSTMAKKMAVDAFTMPRKTKSMKESSKMISVAALELYTEEMVKLLRVTLGITIWRVQFRSSPC